VLKSPEVVQACLQGPLQASCNSPVSSDAFGPLRVPEIDMASAGDGIGQPGAGDAARDAVIANEDQARDADHDRAVLSRSAGAAALRLSQHDLMMLEGAARRVRYSQVIGFITVTRTNTESLPSQKGSRVCPAGKACNKFHRLKAL